MTTQTLAIDLIVADTEIQTRASLNTEHVADLRLAWDAKADIPPVIAYFDKTTYWLSEGFHRLQSAKEAKRGSLLVEVREGSKRDALHNALASNKTHGLRRSNEDKRLAVGKMLDDPEWSKWTDHKIAEHIGVTQPFVSALRKQVISVITPPANGKPAPTTTKRVGRDGKIYKVKKPEPKPKKEPEFDTAKMDAEKKALTVDESLALDERVKQQNSIIEAFAKRVMKAFTDDVPSDPWLDESRLNIARDQIKSACSTIRLAKACDKPCPKCEGKGCKTCRQCGYLPHNSYEMAGGK